MSEEEKKAIELLKQPPDFSLRYYERENAIDIVLKLIKKQQKAIEDMEEELQMYVDTNLMKNKLEEKILQQEEEIKRQQKLINIFIHNEAVRENKDFNEIKDKYYECL